jgi:hypothetical protein
MKLAKNEGEVLFVAAKTAFTPLVLFSRYQRQPTVKEGKHIRAFKSFSNPRAEFLCPDFCVYARERKKKK